MVCQNALQIYLIKVSLVLYPEYALHILQRVQQNAFKLLELLRVQVLDHFMDSLNLYIYRCDVLICLHNDLVLLVCCSNPNLALLDVNLGEFSDLIQVL